MPRHRPAAPRRSHPAFSRRLVAAACSLAVGLATTSCSTINDVSGAIFGTNKAASGTPGFVTGFLGGVVADEPRAALLGREILSSGGNAADAAVAVGFALAVTLPSRAGLGGGGACLAYAPAKRSVNGGVPEAVLFVPMAPAGGGGDRPAAVPMMPRGMFALHARYGKRPFETLVAPAEQLARFGVQASRAFVRDLEVVAGPLAGDPDSRAVFFRDGRPVAEGTTLVQPELSATISQLRSSGVGDFYQGGGARRLEEASARAGGPIAAADLRQALPRLAPGIALPVRGGSTAVFLPPPADGGLAAAAAFRALGADPANYEAASARALGAAVTWRQRGGDPMAALDAPPAKLPPLPASTTFATLDQDGNAVVCALTMNNLFGTGRIAPGTGMLLAASPSAVTPPLLSAALAYNGNLNAFRALAGGSGQAGAPAATAFALAQALADAERPARAMASPPPEPGRANVIECNRFLPEAGDSCAWATDPRGAGLAIGSN